MQPVKGQARRGRRRSKQASRRNSIKLASATGHSELADAAQERAAEIAQQVGREY